MSAEIFRDPKRAAFNLDRIRERAPAGISNLLPTLLAESPDPDSALNLFERLANQAGEELFRLLERNHFLIHYAVAVFGYSQYLGETLIQNLDLFNALAKEKSLDHSPSREDFDERFARMRSRSYETDPALLLARFKKREYIRILLRDVLGIAALAEVTAEISALSDVLIQQGMLSGEVILRDRYGAPQHVDSEGRSVDTKFSVLALGKLGGNELNYNSDVDLLFIYQDGDSPSSAALSNREYFIRLAQQITETLSFPTKEGSVFRIDLRLRPQGNEGEPAVPLSHALRYYSESAQDWELQALIKARPCAGDTGLAREFLHAVQPRVYHQELNFAALETALISQKRISSGRRQQQALHKSARAINVKVDRGGIRDIEFLVQCLQRIYGGEEPWLRSGGTLFSLQKLHDKNHIGGKDFYELNSAYEFLRRVEHRLQLRRGQQTHRLPESYADIEILARSLGMLPATGSIDAQSAPSLTLIQELQSRMSGVAAIYQRLMHAQQAMEQQGRTEFTLNPSQNIGTGHEQSYPQMLQRLAADSPTLHELAGRRDLSARTRRTLYRFLSSALTSSGRYAAVLRAAGAVERAFSIFEISDYLSEILIRHPEEIATVERVAARRYRDSTASGSLWPEEEPATPAADPTFNFLHTTGFSYAQKMALLRQHYRHLIFSAGVTDVLAPRPVFDSLQATTASAEAAIQTAFSIATSSESSQPGWPGPELAVLSLGRLGSCEFDIASDADLLFVRDEQTDAALAGKLAAQIVDVLAAYTQEGTVFPVDTRLRPSGGEGDLVTTPSALRAYFGANGEARAWEGLSFTKLRFMAGSKSVGQRALAMVAEGMHRFAESPALLAEVQEMRAKIATAASGRGEAGFKTSSGGFYDIDFIVSYLQIRHKLENLPANIRQRLHRLASEGLLGDADCATLDYAAEFFRALDHVIRLVTGRTRQSLPGNEHGKEVVEQLTARILNLKFPAGIEAELQRLYTCVREIYNRLLLHMP